MIRKSPNSILMVLGKDDAAFEGRLTQRYLFRLWGCRYSVVCQKRNKARKNSSAVLRAAPCREKPTSSSPPAAPDLVRVHCAEGP
jgi:hypothetical protein